MSTAVLRWGWRLFRREWRQQLLILGLLTIAVAATTWGVGVATNTQLSNPSAATFGTAAALVTLPGADPHLAADVAAIADRWGPADAIETEQVTQSVPLRAENPHGHFNAPLLGLVSGTYPAGPGQVALTSRAASLYHAYTGGTWQAAGTTWRVTGIVQDPSNLADEFALVAPGQVSHPSQVTMLLGSSAVQQAIGNNSGTLAGMPAAATVSFPAGFTSGPPPATIVLVVAVFGLAFIGLLAVAGFSVIAQRRLRALGMLSAIGATERHLHLVTTVNGLLVGVAAAFAGAVLGLAAWLAYVPALQQATGHVVDAANLPWWAIAAGILFTIATALLASARPARTMAQVPVVAALSGRPASPKPVHRSAVPGVIVFAGGVAGLAFTGGLAGVGGGGNSRNSLPLLGGLLAVIAGIFLLAPLAISLLTAGAGPRLPVAVRIAVRDLVRYRARSGAALAAATFAVFLAMSICIVASIRFEQALNWAGPNLSSSQLIIYTQAQFNSGPAALLSPAGLASLNRKVDGLAASLHARSVLPLELAGPTLYQAGTQQNLNFTGAVYLATPQLLAAYGIKASQIAPGTDVLTMRPGLSGLPDLEMTWASQASPLGPVIGMNGRQPSGPCTLSNDCLASPAIQEISSLPGGTSAPNTVITGYAENKYHLQPQRTGWLIQAPAPLTAAQINAARQLASAYGVTAETRSGGLGGPAGIAGGATAAGIVIALGVLAASVGLIRSETAPDLRTLTAVGAGPGTRRMITAATAAALGLLGALLGVAGAVVTGLAWTHSSLPAMFGDVPLTDVVILLAGLPLVATVGGWLLAGREPGVMARQPLD